MAAIATGRASRHVPDLISDGAVEHDRRTPLVGPGTIQPSGDISPESSAVAQATILTGRVEHAEGSALPDLEPAGRQVGRCVHGAEQMTPDREPALGEYEACPLTDKVSLRVERALGRDLAVFRARRRVDNLDAFTLRVSWMTGEAGDSHGHPAHQHGRQAGRQ